MQRVGEESHESNNTIRDRGHCCAVFEGSFKDAAETRDAKTKRGLTKELLDFCSSSEWSYDKLTRFTQLVNDERVDVNAKDDIRGWTPLLRLIYQSPEHEKLINMVRLLIRVGADPAIKAPDGGNILHYLCRFYHQNNLFDLVQLVIDKPGVDINALTSNRFYLLDLGTYEKMTVLHLLCKYYPHDNLIELVRLLLEKGIVIENKHFLYFLLFTYYKHENLIDLLRLLVEKVGADFEGRASFIHFLCEHYEHDNLIKMVKLFVKNGGPVVRIKSKTLLYLCQRYKHNNLLEIIRYLVIGNGVDIVNKTLKPLGENSIHLLCQHYKYNNLINLIEFLLENGVDVNAKTSEGLNALHYLFNYNRQDNLINVISLLIEKGIDVNAMTTEKHFTPLHYICAKYEHKKNIVDLITLLIEKGADVNAKDVDRWTPLHYLCVNYKHKNLVELIRILKDNGADSKAETNEGHTASSLLRSENSGQNNARKAIAVILLTTSVNDRGPTTTWYI